MPKDFLFDLVLRLLTQRPLEMDHEKLKNSLVRKRREGEQGEQRLDDQTNKILRREGALLDAEVDQLTTELALNNLKLTNEMRFK